jgi:hypothetical protein
MGVYFCQSNGPWSKSFCGSANGRDSGKINLDNSTSLGAFAATIFGFGARLRLRAALSRMAAASLAKSPGVLVRA